MPRPKVFVTVDLGTDPARPHRVTCTLDVARRHVRYFRAKAARAAAGISPSDKAEAEAARRMIEAYGAALAVAGFCRACGRPLTDPASVGLGIGPDCAKQSTQEAVQEVAR